jgi:hypothetical protein
MVFPPLGVFAEVRDVFDDGTFDFPAAEVLIFLVGFFGEDLDGFFTMHSLNYSFRESKNTQLPSAGRNP